MTQNTQNKISNNIFQIQDLELKIFDLKLHDIVKLELDFRHLKLNFKRDSDGEIFNFEYEKEWQISLIMGQELNKYSTNEQFFNALDSQQVHIVQLPYQFTRKDRYKFDANIFKIFCWEDTQFIVAVRIHKLFYANYRFHFFNTGSVEIISPYRAIYEEQKIFGFVIKDLDTVNLPVTLPKFQEDGSYPYYMISYYREGEEELLKQPELQEENYFSVNQIYWGEKSWLMTPMIPYFSNCKNQGDGIFLHDLIENKEYCNIVDPEDTIIIEQLSFGARSSADNCTSVEFQCIYDETFETDAKPRRWFQQDQGELLFYIIPEAIDLTRQHAIEHEYQNSQLIPVRFVKEGIPEGKIPREIDFNIYYQQKTKYDKVIVLAEIFMSLMYTPTDEEATGQKNISYTLKFNFRPMTHSELTKAFILDWSVYFIMYIGVGIFSVVELVIFYLYHRISNRKKPRPHFRIWIYIKIIYPEVLKGILIAVLPISFLIITCSIIMTGTFWDRNFSMASCQTPEEGQSIEDVVCPLSIFDNIIFGDIDYESVEQFASVRAGRTGLAIMVIGLYVITYLSSVFLPKNLNKKEIMDNQTFYGNIWEQEQWEGSYFIFISLIVIGYYTNIIIFSYSAFYGTYLWPSIIAFKLLQLIIEYILQKMLNNDILFNVLQQFLSTLITLATLGALDFFDFLFSYFISLGLMMAERCYIPLIFEMITEQIEQKYDLVVNYIKHLLDTEKDQELDDKALEQDYDNTRNQKQNSDSEILLSDQLDNIETEDSLVMQIEDQQEKTIKKKNTSMAKTQYNQLLGRVLNTVRGSNFQNSLGLIDDKSPVKKNFKNSQSKIQDNQSVIDEENSNKDLDDSILESVFDEDFQTVDKFELQFKDLFSEKLQILEEEKEQEKAYFDKYGVEQPKVVAEHQISTSNANFSNKIKKNTPKKDKDGNLNTEQDSENEEQKEEHKNDIQVEGYIQTSKPLALAKYSGFANDTIMVIFFPIYFISIWVFYEENSICKNYNIQKDQMIFYFLFVLLIVPFQIIIDIIFFNVVKNYHHICFINYLNSLKSRFKKRKQRWKTTDFDQDNDLDAALRSLDHWCYSSQYYFISTLQLFGLTFINMGIQTFIQQQHNIFNDRAAVLIIPFWLILCYIIQLFSIACSKSLGLWKSNYQKIQQKKKQKKEKKQKENIRLSQVANSNQELLTKENQPIQNSKTLNLQSCQSQSQTKSKIMFFSKFKSKLFKSKNSNKVGNSQENNTQKKQDENQDYREMTSVLNAEGQEQATQKIDLLTIQNNNNNSQINKSNNLQSLIQQSQPFINAQTPINSTVRNIDNQIGVLSTPRDLEQIQQQQYYNGKSPQKQIQNKLNPFASIISDNNNNQYKSVEPTERQLLQKSQNYDIYYRNNSRPQSNNNSTINQISKINPQKNILDKSDISANYSQNTPFLQNFIKPAQSQIINQNQLNPTNTPQQSVIVNPNKDLQDKSEIGVTPSKPNIKNHFIFKSATSQIQQQSLQQQKEVNFTLGDDDEIKSKSTIDMDFLKQQNYDPEWELENYQEEEDDLKVFAKKQQKLCIFNEEQWQQALNQKEENIKNKQQKKLWEEGIFNNANFRNKFIDYNKYWLKENIRLVLSPRTQDNYRKDILHSFKGIYGVYEDPTEQSQDQDFNQARKDIPILNPYKSRKLRQITKKINEQKSKEIVLYWLNRCRYLKFITSLIAGIIEQATISYCEYCGTNFCLRANPEICIEDIYISFIKDTGIIILPEEYRQGKGHQKIEEWQKYFQDKQEFVTSCFNCTEICLENQIQLQKLQNQRSSILISQQEKNNLQNQEGYYNQTQTSQTSNTESSNEEFDQMNSPGGYNQNSHFPSLNTNNNLTVNNYLNDNGQNAQNAHMQSSSYQMSRSSLSQKHPETIVETDESVQEGQSPFSKRFMQRSNMKKSSRFKSMKNSMQASNRSRGTQLSQSNKNQLMTSQSQNKLLRSSQSQNQKKKKNQKDNIGIINDDTFKDMEVGMEKSQIIQLNKIVVPKQKNSINQDQQVIN